MNKLLYAVVFFLCVSFGYAQQITVKGTVKDNTGLPIPGASVLVKGTRTGQLPILTVISNLLPIKALCL